MISTSKYRPFRAGIESLPHRYSCNVGEKSATVIDVTDVRLGARYKRLFAGSYGSQPTESDVDRLARRNGGRLVNYRESTKPAANFPIPAIH
ncbi:hypothetical protein [Roseimaritima multifibrata]|uniref:hypothetical protein n=1 Tax=Roseimaritima multifibrata TaxID=1930274 RepID=UPI00119E6B0B|nr:hypothetical protein [Roseimaritima multifibrata]